MSQFAWIAKPLSEEGELRIDPRAIFLAAGESRFVVRDGEELFLESEVELAEGEYFTATVNVELFGTGKCYVRRTARLFGARARYAVDVRVHAKDSSRIFVDDRVQVVGADARAYVCTHVVLEVQAVSRVRACMRVEPQAWGATVREELRQLMMDGGARGMNIPELDVLCADTVSTHAASLVPPPMEGIAYLRTRGIIPLRAKELVTQGFLKTVSNV